MRALVVAAGVLALQCDRGPVPVRATASAMVTSDSAGSTASRPRSGVTKSGVACTVDPGYPGMWSLAEASAAVEMELSPGKRAIVAFADSGNHGEAMMWPVSGGPLTPLRLQLDTLASDDIEGAAWAGGHLFTLTSSGAVRRYTPSSAGEIILDRTAYPIGPAPYVCASLHDGNCGKNYEGLCLRGTAKPSRCAGFAASKADGALYCVVFRGDALVLDLIKPPVQLALPRHALSDCAFGSPGGPAEGVLVVTTNIYGGSTTYLVDEATGALDSLDLAGLPNNEAVAIDRDGALYQFMDGNTSVSPTYRATCRGWPSRAER
jgi:hypothetical protein